ncbi:group III truncated hemoglobin [Methyloligella solikamskensis]|uniref:Group III truncated hemoglobin n=1 Tax=Methyloligella solikamskensis TaxID=1177756 RepID=A0ABW3J7A7_9HYPH
MSEVRPSEMVGERSASAAKEAIVRLVDSFYEKVRQDPQLGSVIGSQIGNDWTGHIERMRSFWSSQILPDEESPRDPEGVHLRLTIDEKLLSRWMDLFNVTCDELSDQHLATVFREKVSTIGRRLQRQLPSGGDHPNGDGSS